MLRFGEKCGFYGGWESMTVVMFLWIREKVDLSLYFMRPTVGA